EHARFLLYVGNFYAYKNVRRLIEAHQRLLAEQPDLGLVLVGRLHRAAQPLIKEIEQSGVRNVTFTGYVTEGQRNWLYENCEAYIFPSLSEGF
ncbi:glycosyltransferase, partial [Escherichia coli]